MQNFMETIINAVQTWTKGKIKASTADWNENDSNSDSYIKNRPSKVSVFENDKGYLTEHQDLSDYAKTSAIPTKVSQLTNDKNYLTTVPSEYITETELTNKNYLTSYTETDPTVPAWAKASKKPSYTASEVGADASGSANQALKDANAYTNEQLSEMGESFESVIFSMYGEDALYDEESEKITTIRDIANDEVNNAMFDLISDHNTASDSHGDIRDQINRQSEVIDTKAGKIVTGQEFKLGDSIHTAPQGAEIFNDYSENVAIGRFSHAEGYCTIANGADSHAEGCHTNADGHYTHAEGYFTNASGRCSHVQGKYNIIDTSDTYAHIVGNGSDHTNRSNAHTLDWDGNAWYQGDVYVGSTSGTNKDEGSKKLATEEYVTNALDGELPNAINTALAQAKASGEFDGAKGDPGYTPVKGTDYYTEADKQEMITAVIAALPDASEVSY